MTGNVNPISIQYDIFYSVSEKLLLSSKLVIERDVAFCSIMPLGV